jgi:3-oxoacyl-[acyl-carrier-protein] synthase-1
VGEAAAFVLLDGGGEAPGDGDLALLGVGESSDAHHLSAPHPEGMGARLAMQAALAQAQLAPAAVDYINLHGTGTIANDSAEGKAVASLFGPATPGSSTKGATGHALGAAGALEVILCALALRHGFMPGGLNCESPDPGIGLLYLQGNRASAPRVTLSNSLGFGGTNCSVLLGRMS